MYGMSNETRSVYNPCEQNYNLCMKSDLLNSINLAAFVLEAVS
jgi:hypothetical protein